MEPSFDPTLKTLTDVSPSDWLALLRRRRRRVTIEDSDSGTIVSGATDKLLRVHDRPEYLLHLDFESGHFQSDRPLRLRLYNTIFDLPLLEGLAAQVLTAEDWQAILPPAARRRPNGR